MAILTNKNKDNDLVFVECVKNKLKVRLKSSKTDTKELNSVVPVTEPAKERSR